MTEWNAAEFVTETVGASAVEKNRLVKDDGSGGVIHCGSGERPIGVARRDGAIGAGVAVHLLNSVSGTEKIIASAAIAAGATVYSAADGKVTSTDSGQAIGTAKSAPSGDGVPCEVRVDVV